jgi:hypothetical protein
MHQGRAAATGGRWSSGDVWSLRFPNRDDQENQRTSLLLAIKRVYSTTPPKAHQPKYSPPAPGCRARRGAERCRREPVLCALWEGAVGGLVTSILLATGDGKQLEQATARKPYDGRHFSG